MARKKGAKIPWQQQWPMELFLFFLAINLLFILESILRPNRFFCIFFLMINLMPSEKKKKYRKNWKNEPLTMTNESERKWWFWFLKFLFLVFFYSWWWWWWNFQGFFFLLMFKLIVCDDKEMRKIMSPEKQMKEKDFWMWGTKKKIHANKFFSLHHHHQNEKKVSKSILIAICNLFCRFCFVYFFNFFPEQFLYRAIHFVGSGGWWWWWWWKISHLK